MRVGVAVVDTGIFRHIDFGNRIVAFADFVNGKILPYDDSGHGTHVSGIIAGSGAASNKKYRGIAPQAAIVSVKVLDNMGNGKISDVLNGLKWIYQNRYLYNIRVVNISFGTTSGNDMRKERELIDSVEKLWDAGIIVVAAAGNSGPDVNSITVPGISKKIITVGAFDDMAFSGENNMRYYSGRGPTDECVVKPEVVVTGANIVACSNKKNSYSVKSGTSMAAPIVSGAVARIIEKRSDITPKEVKIKLRECCYKISIPSNQQGWGALDVTKFVR